MDERAFMDQTDETKIALIGKDIGFINKNVDEIRQDIKSLAGIFVQTTLYQEDKKAFELRMIRMENSSNLFKWLSPTLAGILGSVLTILVISYLNNLH